MDNKVLVITGMHRSGTSLLAQWLHKCGLHVGDEFLAAGVGNEEGHYEDLDFYERHRNILIHNKLPEDGMIHQTSLSISDKQRQELRRLVLIKNTGQQQWGWKEPRTSLLLAEYNTLIPDAKYLVILRDYQQVVSSLISRLYNRTAAKYARKKGLGEYIWKRFKAPYRKEKLLKKYSEHYLKVWIAYNKAILHHLQQLDDRQYLVVEHSALSANDKQVFEHLSDWGFALNYFDFNKVYKQKLLSNVLDITAYVNDRSLLETAQQLQEQLKESHRLSHL